MLSFLQFPTAEPGFRMSSIRLFIAIELPDHYKKTLGELRTAIPGARWVTAEQIHLTLAFLGEVDEETSKRLITKLARIKADDFELGLTGTGCFPNRQRPRVVWVGVKPEPGLTSLAAMIRESVLACGIPPEERPFSPHLTLARLKFPATREVGAFLDQHTSVDLPPFSGKEFTLFQSRLSQQGTVHITLRNFPLIKHKPIK
jgi:RNA 2',3'-cyclic 3'-phosphodiesterase